MIADVGALHRNLEGRLCGTVHIKPSGGSEGFLLMLGVRMGVRPSTP